MPMDSSAPGFEKRIRGKRGRPRIGHQMGGMISPPAVARRAPVPSGKEPCPSAPSGYAPTPDTGETSPLDARWLYRDASGRNGRLLAGDLPPRLFWLPR